MKKSFWIAGIAIFYLGCQKISDTSLSIPSIEGYVQKGPFTSGTQVLMYELKTNLSQTGKTFTTTITDNRGSFRITDIKLLSDYVLLSANGFYFNEVQGALSASPLQLFALSDIKDASSINVNILTHLEKRRVEYLVAQGKEFQEAKKTAQSEILAVFGITGAQARVSEKLDITTTGEDNAMLLAISVMLHGKLSVAELSELLSFIATDMEKDGSLESESIKKALLDNTIALDVKQIRQNLVARYQNLGLSANIPDFEKYITGYLNLRVALPTLTTTQATEITASTFKSGGTISSTGGAPILQKGVVWSTSPNPTISLTTKTVDTTSNSTYSSNTTGLNPKTLYYYRSYATNIKGTAYGNELEATTSDVDITTGLVAYYPFNGNANDESGNGNNGITNQVALTLDRFNNINSAYFFDGITSFIDLPNLFFNNAWPEYSLSLWINPTSFIPSNGPGQTILNTNPHRGLGFGFSYSGSKKLYFFNQRDSYSYNWDIIDDKFNFDVKLNEWIHVTIIKKNNYFNYYVNGSLDKSTPITYITESYLYALRIGAITCCIPENFNGKIDDLRIFNRALSQEEINYLATH